jgi:hypothetical protein
MGFNRSLNVRVRKIDPYKRMQNIHPFYIWQVLMRLRTMDKLMGEEDKWHTREEVCRFLFANFDEFPQVDRDLIVLCKVDWPLRYLRSTYWVEQRIERKSNPEFKHRPFTDPFIEERFEEYRGKPHAFGDMPGLSQEMRYQFTADSMDKDWGCWIGRPDYEGRARRYLRKQGILV